jgi:hypothetical protein
MSFLIKAELNKNSDNSLRFTMHQTTARLAILPVLSLILLLFVEGPDHLTGEVYTALWQSGHFFLFLGMVYILLQWPRLKKTFLIQLLVCLVFSLVVGTLSELLQLLVARDFQLSDIVNDMLGGLAGFCLTQFSRQNTFLKQVTLLFLVGVLTLFGMRSFIVTVIDQQQMNAQFPVLADGENLLELYRWEHHSATLSLSSEYPRQGERAVKIDFSPAHYPEIILTRFINDWSQYHDLRLSIYNPGVDTVQLNLKIYDAKHPQNHFQFNDRFNRELKIISGWNDIVIPLVEVKMAPQTRTLDLSKIQSVSLFLVSPDKKMTLYLDQMRLSP